jgi:hypothetical protein
MNPEAVRHQIEEHRLVEEAQRLERLVRRIDNERHLLRAPIYRVKTGDGPDVWEGGAAETFRSRLCEIEALLDGGSSSSVGGLLGDAIARINHRIASIYDDARAANHAARLAMAATP